MTADPPSIIALTGKTEARLNERQLVDYRDHRERYVRWLLTVGKEPDRARGYATSTAQNHAYRTDHFYRWVWNREGRYTLELTHRHADGYLAELAYEDWTDAHRAKCYQAVKAMYRWLEIERGLDEWDPVLTFYERDEILDKPMVGMGHEVRIFQSPSVHRCRGLTRFGHAG